MKTTLKIFAEENFSEINNTVFLINTVINIIDKNEEAKERGIKLIADNTLFIRENKGVTIFLTFEGCIGNLSKDLYNEIRVYVKGGDIKTQIETK